MVVSSLNDSAHGHAVFADGVLIRVKYLINGRTIEQVAVDCVTYYHIELPLRDAPLAEGLPAETYLDTGDRGAFANGGVPIRLFPDFSTHAICDMWEANACAPLMVSGPPGRRRAPPHQRTSHPAQTSPCGLIKECGIPLPQP